MAIKINLMPRQDTGSVDERQTRPFYFILVLIFFLITLLAFASVYYYNTYFLGKQLSDIEKQNAEIKENISKSATLEELSDLNIAVSKGKSIQQILSNHRYGSKIIELLESLTVKSVIYNKFSAETESDGNIKVTISGDADSFTALAKQLMVFKKSKDIKEVIFSDAMSGKDAKVIFSIVLKIDSKFIVTKPVISLIGPNSIKKSQGSIYTDEGAIAVDGVDGKLDVSTSGTVDTEIVGTYTLTYTAVNAAGNSVTATRTIEVVAQ